jgi:hypothetical protein
MPERSKHVLCQEVGYLNRVLPEGFQGIPAEIPGVEHIYGEALICENAMLHRGQSARAVPKRIQVPNVLTLSITCLGLVIRASG